MLGYIYLVLNSSIHICFIVWFYQLMNMFANVEPSTATTLLLWETLIIILHVVSESQCIYDYVCYFSELLIQSSPF